MTTPSHHDIFSAIDGLRHDLNAKFDSLSDRIGHEQTLPDGKLIGTGLTGRLIRTEAKVLAYDRLKERIYGGLAVATALIAVIWWLTKQKLADIFGVGS